MRLAAKSKFTSIYSCSFKQFVANPAIQALFGITILRFQFQQSLGVRSIGGIHTQFCPFTDN